MNTKSEKTDRRQIIEERILSTIQEYVQAFKSPCPMKLLSAKYSRTCMELGGLPELLTQMKNSKQIRIFLTRSGHKSVLPTKSKLEVKDAAEL